MEKAGVFALIVWATVIREWSVLGLLDERELCERHQFRIVTEEVLA